MDTVDSLVILLFLGHKLTSLLKPCSFLSFMYEATSLAARLERTVSPSNWQLWRIDPSTASLRPTYSRVSSSRLWILCINDLVDGDYVKNKTSFMSIFSPLFLVFKYPVVTHTCQNTIDPLLIFLTWHPYDGWAGVFYLTSSGSSARSSFYSRQAGISDFWYDRLERPLSPRRICAVTFGFQTTTQLKTFLFCLFPFLPRHYHMTRVLLLPFSTTVWTPVVLAIINIT